MQFCTWGIAPWPPFLLHIKALKVGPMVSHYSLSKVCQSNSPQWSWSFLHTQKSLVVFQVPSVWPSNLKSSKTSPPLQEAEAPNSIPVSDGGFAVLLLHLRVDQWHLHLPLTITLFLINYYIINVNITHCDQFQQHTASQSTLPHNLRHTWSLTAQQLPDKPWY